MQLSDDSLLTLDVLGPVEIYCENRRTVLEAVVLPGNAEPLLGAIPLQDLEVLIDPRSHRLIVNPEHPYLAGGKLKGRALRGRRSVADDSAWQWHPCD